MTRYAVTVNHVRTGDVDFKQTFASEKEADTFAKGLSIVPGVIRVLITAVTERHVSIWRKGEKSE